MRISFVTEKQPKSGAVVAGLGEGGKLPAAAKELDKAAGGALSRALSHARSPGKRGDILEVTAPGGLSNSRVLLVGLGKPAELTARNLEDLGGSLAAKLNALGESEATLFGTTFAGGPSAEEAGAHLAFGALLRSYRFDKYRTTEKADAKPSLKKLAIGVEKTAPAKRIYDGLEKVAAGVFTTRDIVSEPANIIYPKSFVQEAKKLEKLGIKLQVLGEKEMKKLGMGALLGVGQGSIRESQLLVLRWDGLAEKAKSKSQGKSPGKAGQPLAIVGKGVTFDTGGISIKPAAGMGDMKWDMGGAGVVLGLMAALAGRKAKVNVIGICGLVENMPDGNAQRPGDIVTSASGQTIEVLNTDAEGRLVLADALWYAQEKFKPKTIVDLATLTGAIMVSLGRSTAGLFSNDDDLSTQLTAAGKEVSEPLWRMPMGEEYDRMIDSDAADMKNIGGRWAGSTTAAQFLQRFVQKGTPWAHLDIAGVTWSEKDQPTVPKGATAFGVRLLDRWIRDNHEGK
ncbi:MAG: leucyl aminopeptidase [Rhodovibrionaceae bacterium]